MIYTKIRVDFKYGPKGRFYRVILVKEDINLFNLGVGLGLALGAEFEHCFLITERNLHKEYVMAIFIEDPVPGSRYLANYTLNDLGEKFDYEYDTGDGWDFTCRKYKRKVELDSKEDIIVSEGAGQGIWEKLLLQSRRQGLQVILAHVERYITRWNQDRVLLILSLLRAQSGVAEVCLLLNK